MSLYVGPVVKLKPKKISYIRKINTFISEKGNYYSEKVKFHPTDGTPTKAITVDTEEFTWYKTWGTVHTMTKNPEIKNKSYNLFEYLQESNDGYQIWILNSDVNHQISEKSNKTQKEKFGFNSYSSEDFFEIKSIDLERFKTVVQPYLDLITEYFEEIEVSFGVYYSEEHNYD